MKNIFDLIIIGAGPAGLSASIYASRYGVAHLIVGALLGGQISETHKIDNYPGLEDMSGFEFAQKWGNHAKKYGVEIVATNVDSIIKDEQVFILALANGKTLKAKTILLATGTKRRKLAIAGEKEFLGRGVSYCATCDGFFYKNKVVGVVGGGDSAVSSAVYLGNICSKVYLIYRGDKLKAEPYWIREVEKNPKIEVIFETNVTEILGQEKVEKVHLAPSTLQGEGGLSADEAGGEVVKSNKTLQVDGLFIEAGSLPNIDYAKNLGLETNEKGYIKIQKNGETSVSGVFSAGDITDGSDGFCQVVTAASEGAISARAIYRFLKK